MTTIQQEYWDRSPVAVGEGFRVYMNRNGKRLEAVCTLLTHQLGFELRLNINGELRRSQVCRSTDDALSLTEKWKTCHARQRLARPD